MGERGPQPDPNQAAKGNPGRRKSKALRAAEDAARIAQLLAPVIGPIAELPAMLQEVRFAPAAALWKRLAPELRSTHRLPKESEFIFVQLCVYAQEWMTTTQDLHANGFTQSVETVKGGKMERRRPTTLDRQQAFSNVMDLSGRFGLTPHDLYSLFKDQAAAAVRNPGLFGDQRQEQPAAQAENQPGRIGGLSAFRSEPPPRPN